MPTVLRFDGVRAVVYPNDHAPGHVHVLGPDAEAVFVLNCPDGPLSLRETFGFAAARLRRIDAVLSASIASLCEAWERIDGDR